MRVLQPVASAAIPPRIPPATVGRPRNKSYDAVIERAKLLPVGNALPIECADKKEAEKLRCSLRNREAPELRIFCRNTVVYIERV